MTSFTPELLPGEHLKIGEWRCPNHAVVRDAPPGTHLLGARRYCVTCYRFLADGMPDVAPRGFAMCSNPKHTERCCA